MRTLALAIVSCLLLSGCGSEASQPVEEVGTGAGTAVYKVCSQKVETHLEATGTIQPDLEGGAKIVPAVGGVVQRILVKVGDPVKKGTPLITIRSADVSDAYAGYLSALAQLKQAERMANLDRELFEAGAVTKMDLLNAESAREQQKALAEGFRKKLEIYGVSPKGSFQDFLTINSPIEGYAADIQAHVGDRFDNSTGLMTIARPDRVVLVANVYDTLITRIANGRKVVFQTDVFPERSFNGSVTYISHMEDPDSKTVKVYIAVPNNDALFKQNMFLKVRIAGESISLPVVPTTAILYKDGDFYVHIRRAGKFEMAKVKPVMEVEGKFTMVEGVREGDEIACSAIELDKQ